MESTPHTRSLRPSPRALALAAFCALAPLPSLAGTPGDPLEKLNRATYAFNDALDRMLARPAARAYVKVVPAPIRTGVSNFVGNLTYPEVIVNDVLQGKFKHAGSDIARLLINTTVGIGGIGDPATRWGFQSHDEDFGQTLGHWGVKPGPYLVVPVLGPSDFRDAPAKLVDAYGDVYTYFRSTSTRYGLYLMTQFNKRVDLLAADTALRNAYDPYVFVRNAYVARRNYLVHDGNVPEDNFDDPMSALPPAADGVSGALSGTAESQSVTAANAALAETPAIGPPAITAAELAAASAAGPAPGAPSNP